MRSSFTALHLPRALNGVSAGDFGRLAARPARLLLRIFRAQQKAFALAIMLGANAAAIAATPANTAISNTATATYRIGPTATPITVASAGTAVLNTAACVSVGVRIELLQYIPAARAAFATNATIIAVQPGMYSTSGLIAGPYAPLAAPTLLGNAVPTAMPASLLLAPLGDAAGNPLSSYSRNEPIFVRVVSYDANVNAAVADTLAITLTTAIGGDSELVLLTETGPSTGVFVTAVPSVFAALGSAAVPNDGIIEISAHNETIKGVYHHDDCTTGAIIANSSSGLIDPYGIVFDSSSGAAIAGASLSLIDSATNQTATVYCDDGVTVMPQPVTSGSPTICDATMIAGGFRFPQVAAGSYRVAVSPPTAYSSPSAVPASALPALVGTPSVTPAILGNPGPTPGGSYGGTFTLWGPALKLDIPVDPASTTMTIRKTAGKSVVSTGDFVPYTLAITNNSATSPVVAGLVADHLPAGFRYQKGSTRLDGVAVADPLVSTDARTLTFSMNIAAAATATVAYVLEVTPGARTGTADNTAAATGNTTSNTARASVQVREDLYRNKSILIGRVIEGNCDKDDDRKGLANARIVLQDGSYILTDKEGRWHIDNLRPGTHVVQLDLDSLPKDYEAVSCADDTRFSGRQYSQFVNLRPGSLWRADFHVQKKTASALRLTQTLGAQQDDSLSLVSLGLVGDTALTGYSATVVLPESGEYLPGSASLNGNSIDDPVIADRALIFRGQARPAHWQDQLTFKVARLAPDATIRSLVRFTPTGRATQNLPVAQITLVDDAPVSASSFAEVSAEATAANPTQTTNANDGISQLLEILPYDAAWLASAQPGIEWLHPQESFHPNLPVVMVAAKHEVSQKLSLLVNGVAVDPLRFDGTRMNAAGTVALSTWRGVAVHEGDNRVELVISDAAGKVIERTVRNIHYAATPDRIEFVPQLSRLVADGKTRPMIAVRFLDKDGIPVRRGISGEFMLNEPYRSYDRREGIEREPLSARIGGTARYEVMSDGMAMIELEPTTQTGEAVLNFQFNDRHKQELRAWLDPGQRDWILVGFGEGTLGQKTLSGNIQGLNAAEGDQQLFDDNQLAFYAKGSIRGDYLLTIAYDSAKETGNNVLKQAVDPTRYYTLYADASQARYDAASSSRLYVKLERKQFYALFGDYDTGLTVTELSRYSRTLNGVKSEYKGETVGYNAFATVTAQAYVKDEIPGNGTSGVYRLSRSNLVINSDKVRIETRDRFQSQNIVGVQTLTRYLDYDIDYHNGTLTFREPINARDGSFNPIYIVAEFESADPADEKASFGGRGSFKPVQDLEVGATLVHEGTMGATGDLKGMDITYQLDDQTRLRAETATTDRDLAVPVTGGAWLGELTHHEEQWDAKAYLREQDGAFGMGQQAAAEIATRKYGVDGRYRISDASELKAQAYRQQNLANSAQNSVTEGRVDTRFSDMLDAYYGARITQEQDATGTGTQNNQLLGGAAYTLLDKRLTLHGTAEISTGAADSGTMPDRMILGTDYRVTEQSRIFAEQEFARGEQISANTTRVGIRTQPWQGNEMSASVGGNYSNDAERIYSNLGMVQRWQIDEHWQTNFSVDRSQTMRNTATPINLDTPLPSGSGGVSQLPSASGDYTSSAFSLAYSDKLWSSDGRIELRDSTLERQRNLQFGLQRQLDSGQVLAAGYTQREVANQTGDTRNTDLRLSYAHRPDDSRWVWFDRADYITQTEQAAISSVHGAKLVNNLHANYMPGRGTQISMQYGAKYVQDTINDTDYKGYTDLIGAEVRHDLTSHWDVGTFGSVMRSLNAGVNSYGLGVSVGYRVVDNMWLSAGYNLRGMDDRDFADASYRAQGPYITLRMKIDQDTFGLNKGSSTTRTQVNE